MAVFALDDHLLDQYTGFARSFTRIRSAELQQEVNRLYAGRRFWPEPLLQLNPHYEGGGSIRSLVGERGLVEDCARIFIYSAHAKTRKSFGEMTRKLSDTLSQ